MGEVTQFVILGLGAGAVYAIAAFGVVVIARGSNVLSFAQGGFALVGAYVYFEATEHGMSAVAATVTGTLAAALAGVICFFLVMRPLRNATALTKLVATLGVLAVLRAAAVLIFRDSLKLISGPLPHELVEPIAGVRVTEDRLWLILAAIVIAAVIWALLRFSRFGLETRGVAENERTAAAMGVAPDRVAALNWALGAGLGGLAGVLVAPITGLSVPGIVLLSFSGLAAALFGQFRALPLTLLGGLLLGVGESLLGRYVHLTGIEKAVPFIAVILILVIWPTSVTRRARVIERLPALGSGRIHWQWVLAATALATILTLALAEEWTNALTTTFILASIALSLVVLTGYTNQLSLAQHAIAGIGALVAARVSQDVGLPFLLCLLIGMVAVVPVALAMALPALRTRGVALAVVTVGFALVIEQVVLSNDALTGGLAGTTVAPPAIGPLDLDPVTNPKAYALLCLGYLVLMLLLVALLRRSRLGRQMIAIRDNPAAAEALGTSVVRVKAAAFVIASMIAAGGGVLAGFRTTTVTYEQFGLMQSLDDVMMAVVGGVGFIVGPIIGSLALGFGISGKALTEIFPKADDWLALVAGFGLIATLLSAPDGIAGAIGSALRKRWPEKRSAPKQRVKEGRVEVDRPRRSLSVEQLGVSFGGVRALDGVSFRVDPGEIVGLVGANGAGKTTVVDIITGRVAKHEGRVYLGEQDLGGQSPWRRSLAGVGRSFQSLELFEDMTVLENLQVGAELRDGSSAAARWRGGGAAELDGPVADAIVDLGIEDVLLSRPRELPYGRRRMVALARALAGAPEILLLDEPAAGVDRHARDELAALLRHLAGEWRIGVVLIEHDVKLVMEVSDRVIALAAGRTIATGTPQEVRADEGVVAAFLGPSGAEAAS